MRKCRSCGYLLLGEGDSCTRCGAPLEVVTAGAPAPAVVPGSGRTPPAAPAPPAWGPPPPSGPPVPASGPISQPLPALREAWHPVTVTTPVARAPRSTRLGMIALAVVIALVVGVGAMHLRSDPLPAGTSAFASGGGVTYTSPDGAFQVQLPKAPELDQQPINMNGVTATLYTAIVSTDDYEIGGGSMVMPSVVAPANVSAALDTVMTAVDQQCERQARPQERDHARLVAGDGR